MDAAGLIVLGYPFHPPAKPDAWRGEVLKQITTPTLLLQGERDTFGFPRPELRRFPLLTRRIGPLANRRGSMVSNRERRAA